MSDPIEGRQEYDNFITELKRKGMTDEQIEAMINHIAVSILSSATIEPDYDDEYHDKQGNYITDRKELYYMFDEHDDSIDGPYTCILITPADYYDEYEEFFEGYLGPQLDDILTDFDFNEIVEATYETYSTVSATQIEEAFKKIGWKAIYMPDEEKRENW